MTTSKIMEWLKDISTKGGLKRSVQSQQLFKIQNNGFKESDPLFSLEVVRYTK